MTDPLRVLVVDDETSLAQVIAGYLEREGFQVTSAYDGPSAVEQARRDRPDLVVLDVMLPGFDGIEVCRQLRTFTDAYIIMLTARDEEVDKVVGLSVGADDYLVKPFSPRELIARVRAMLRRPRTTDAAARAVSSPPVTFGDLVVDTEGRQVIREGVRLELTRTEFDLFATLAARPRAAFTRRQLLDAAWGEGWYGDEHVVDVHIAHLRSKIGDDAASPRYIRTVRGVGYGLGSG
jgi:DNA-binding response OmpR family regulator